MIPLIAFAEACPGIGLVVSGAILLGVCTVMYTEQIATLSQMLPLAFSGACLADHLGFYLGRWIGPPFHHTRFALRRKAMLDKTEAMFRKHSELAILLGRLMTAIRSLTPLLAGASGTSVQRSSRALVQATVPTGAGTGARFDSLPRDCDSTACGG